MRASQGLFAILAVLAGILLLGPPARLSAQPVFGATSSISAPIMIDPQSVNQSSIDWQATFRPTIAVEGSEFSFHAEGELSYDSVQSAPSLSIDRFELSLFPLSFLSLHIGRFQYLPGRASLLSQTDFFSRIDLVDLLSGDFADAVVPSDLLQVDLYASNLYLKLTAQPIPQAILLPSPTSPWFPMQGLPQSLTFTFPSPRTLTLGSVILEPTPIVPFSLSNISVSAEAGGSFSLLDAALIYYHGRDYSPTAMGTIIFPNGLYGTYNIEITPVYPIIDSIGLDLSTTFWRMRVWLDSAFTFQKTFLTSRLAASTFSNLTATSPFAGATVGASIQTDHPNATFSLGYSGGYRFQAITAVIEPLLSSDIIARAQAAFFRDRFHVNVTTLVDVRDWSIAELSSLSFDPSESLDVSITLPLFFGAESTDFGQYSRNFQLTSSVTWRF